MYLIRYISLVVAILFSSIAFANEGASPICYEHRSGPYCSYNGKVDRIYVNSSGVILMYFEKPFDVEIAANVGFTVSNGSAGIIKIADNPSFAEMFYSTALAAQASNRKVSVQMRKSGSYLTIDRIWLSKP